MTAAGINVDGKVLREKTDNVPLSLGIDNFQAFGGWLHQLKAWINLPELSVVKRKKKVSRR